MTEARIFYSAQPVDCEVGDSGIGVRFPKRSVFPLFTYFVGWVSDSSRLRSNMPVENLVGLMKPGREPYYCSESSFVKNTRTVWKV